MQLTRNPDVGTPERNFIPADFDPADKESLRESVDALLARTVDEPNELDDFLRDWSELTGIVDAEKARRYIAKTCYTDDEEIKESYLSYEREVVPFYSELDDSLDRKYLASPARDKLADHYEVFDRRRKTKADLFRKENTLLEAEDTELHGIHRDPGRHHGRGRWRDPHTPAMLRAAGKSRPEASREGLQKAGQPAARGQGEDRGALRSDARHTPQDRPERRL